MVPFVQYLAIICSELRGLVWIAELFKERTGLFKRLRGVTQNYFRRYYKKLLAEKKRKAAMQIIEFWAEHKTSFFSRQKEIY